MNMRYSFLFIFLFAIIAVGAGCKRDQTNQTIFTPSTTPTETETPQSEPADTLPATTAEKTLYRGTWFDVEYPENFTAAPTSPTFVAENNQVRNQTDEAKFTSPDGSVEFFVYSPQWGGNPKDYLNIKATEELVNEEVSTTTDANSDLRRTRWVSIRAKDNSYYRSFLSITTGINLGTYIHHVFGIKYTNETAYRKYEGVYMEFKESLRQYAD